MTLSTRYFVEAGKTNPESRLMAISTKPSASSPRLGFISAQTSGRLFQAFFRFALWVGGFGGWLVAMIGETNSTPRRFDACAVWITIWRIEIGRSCTFQSPAVPTRGTLAVDGRS